MNKDSSEQLFRQAAVGEAGMPISAGARQSHAQAAPSTIAVDLSQVPEGSRLALIAVIRDIVALATGSARKEA
jgi:hypothetical protein